MNDFREQAERILKELSRGSWEEGADLHGGFPVLTELEALDALVSLHKTLLGKVIGKQVLEGKIKELKRAKLHSFITLPHMHRVDRRIEQLEAELNAKSKEEKA